MNFLRRNRKNNLSKPIGERAGFYLVYLAFYFTPWLFKSPTANDVIAAVMAIAVFLPIYFHASKQAGLNSVPHVAAMSAIGFAVSPFFGSHGVFHIYAMVQAGLIRPEKSAWFVAVITSVVFAVFSWLLSVDWWDMGFPLLMGAVISIATISAAGTIEKNAQLERARELEQHLAAITERERIAHDLHDLLGQTLTMVALKSEVATRLFDKKPDQAKQELIEIRDAARVALKDVREAVAGMNKTSLQAELKRAHQILASAGVKLTVVGVLPTLNLTTDQVLGLTVREAMTNIVRHSNATEVTFEVKQVDGELLLVVEDNGVADSINEGSGLVGLRKRIERLGGKTSMSLTPGFRISMQVPNWEVA